MSEFFSVEYTSVTNLKTGEHWPPSWRVCALQASSPTGRAALDTEFARQKDAEIGKAALLAAGLDTLEKLEANRHELHRIMIEALQW